MTKLDAAAEWYRKAIKINPILANVYNNLALVLNDQRKY
jgi:Tfp pilus assembly protein PilF